jgi:hypothetical protein
MFGVSGHWSTGRMHMIPFNPECCSLRWDLARRGRYIVVKLQQKYDYLSNPPSPILFHKIRIAPHSLFSVRLFGADQSATGQ